MQYSNKIIPGAAAIPAKKMCEPQNGVTEGSPGEGSPGRGNAPLGKKDLAGTAVDTAIKVGSRQSNLARAQVNEVLQEIRRFHPQVEFEVRYVDTYGDKDQTSSLRTLDKTDFFTKEIDEMLLSGICRIAIHSAKDLPEPLPAGLTLICLTEGLDSSDSLVLRQGTRIEDLREGALIATSSARREESVNRLRKGLNFMDIRGTIEQRLAKLERGQADGVVVAEAALIRLELTHLNRIKLPLPGVKGQGQLAIVAQENDHEMAKLFACLDVRKHSKRVLYFGLDPTNLVTQGAVTHTPLIQIVPYPLDQVKLY